MNKNHKSPVQGVCSLLFFMALISSHSSAFWMEDTTAEIAPRQDRVAQKINNPDASGHVMTVNVERIKDPFKMEPLQEGTKGDLLFSPSRAMVGPGKDAVVNFFYNGPSDDKERYYRVIWTDEALVAGASGISDSKGAAVAARTILSTVLVVHPRQENFKFELASSLLRNTGNTSFRYIAYGACLRSITPPKDGICRETRYLMPGMARPFKSVDILANSARVGIWRGEQYVLAK